MCFGGSESEDSEVEKCEDSEVLLFLVVAVCVGTPSEGPFWIKAVTDNNKLTENKVNLNKIWIKLQMFQTVQAQNYGQI